MPRKNLTGRRICNNYVVVKSVGHPKAYSNYVYEHVLVMEGILGRFLSDEEVVHHINEIKTDNRPDNLMLFPNQREHRIFHIRLRALQECGNPDYRQCTFCKQWDDPSNLKIRPHSSNYHTKCAREETKRRYAAGLCIRNGKNGGKSLNIRYQEKHGAAL